MCQQQKVYTTELQRAADVDETRIWLLQHKIVSKLFEFMMTVFCLFKFKTSLFILFVVNTNSLLLLLLAYVYNYYVAAAAAAAAAA